MSTSTRRLFLAALAATLTACAGGAPASGDAPTSPADDPVFRAWYRNLQDELQGDPYHKPIDVRGPRANEEFTAQVQAAYRKRITTDALREWIDVRYPGHGYEIEYITKRLPR